MPLNPFDIPPSPSLCVSHSYRYCHVMHRIELFYGLQGLTGYDRSNRRDELLEDRKFRILYPDPSVCCPSMTLLIA
jgi:hypothetical protein